MDRAPVTAAVLVTLRAMGSWQVGDGAAPAPTAGQALATTPYLILYSIDGGGFSGPEWNAPHADATLVYQVTVVGERRDQVEMLADKVRARILGRGSNGAFLATITPTGAVVMDRDSDGGPGGVDHDGTVFTFAERFALTVTPA